MFFISIIVSWLYVVNGFGFVWYTVQRLLISEVFMFCNSRSKSLGRIK